MLAAVDSYFGLIGSHQHGTAQLTNRPKQLSTAANIQAHSLFKGFSSGLSPSDPRGHSALFSGCVITTTQLNSIFQQHPTTIALNIQFYSFF